MAQTARRGTCLGQEGAAASHTGGGACRTKARKWLQTRFFCNSLVRRVDQSEFDPLPIAEVIRR